jgi:alpha-amylase/alpha-mannosidase (GH57 family)
MALSISGLALEQLEAFAPEVLFDIEDLVGTGRVEILTESYYHSLSSVRDRNRFWEEVELHRDAIEKRFGVRPRVLRNTELIFDEQLAHEAHERGFSHVLACIAERDRDGSRCEEPDRHPAQERRTLRRRRLPLLRSDVEGASAQRCALREVDRTDG